MVVNEPIFPLLNGTRSWSPDQSGATERRYASDSNKPDEHENGELAYPLVSPPPFITRVFPGL